MPNFEIHEFTALLAIVALGGGTTLFWIWTLVDCLTKEPAGTPSRVFWAVGIALTHIVGAILYWSFRRPLRRRQAGEVEV
jgi:hypothetical protein